MGIRRTKKVAYMSHSFDDVERGFGDAKDGKERLPGESWEYLVGYDAVLDGKSFNQAMDEAEAGWDKEEAMYGRGGMNSGYGPTTITPNSSRKTASIVDDAIDAYKRGEFASLSTEELAMLWNSVNFKFFDTSEKRWWDANIMSKAHEELIARGYFTSSATASARKTASNYNFPTVTNAEIQKFKKLLDAIGYGGEPDDELHDILLANGGFKKAMDRAGIVNDAYNDARGAGGLEIEDGWGLSVLIETTSGGDVASGFTGGYLSYKASDEERLAILDAIVGKYRSKEFIESAQLRKKWILEEMNKTSSRKNAGVEDVDRWNSLWKCDECWRKETMYHPDTGQVDEAESRGWVIEYDDNEDIDWVLCPECAGNQKTSSRKTSATSGEVEAIIGKFDGDHKSRVQAMADLMEYGPNYNRSVTEHVLTAMRFQGDEREWFVRRAEAQANLARTGEWLPPIHPSESGQQLTLDIESSFNGCMCEQKCGRIASVIASCRTSDGIEGQYCLVCANALDFKISRRKIDS